MQCGKPPVNGCTKGEWMCCVSVHCEWVCCVNWFIVTGHVVQMGVLWRSVLCEWVQFYEWLHCDWVCCMNGCVVIGCFVNGCLVIGCFLFMGVNYAL